MAGRRRRAGSGEPRHPGLVTEISFAGTRYLLARPLLTMHFFPSPGALSTLGPALAGLVETYLAEVPADALRVWLDPWEGAKLDRDRVAAHLAELRAGLPDGWFELSYRGGDDLLGAAPTSYGLDLRLHEPDGLGQGTVRLQFPLDEACTDPDEVQARFLRYAGLLDLEAGGCGIELVVRQGRLVPIADQEEFLRRHRRNHFVGFEHHPDRDRTPGTAPGPSWLTLLGADLATRLDGAALSTVEAAGARVMTLSGGVCVRAARYPGVGAGAAPADLGALPSVARMLALLRGGQEQEHYARLDTLTDGRYDNEAPALGTA